MSKYHEIALSAVEIIHKSAATNPVDAWKLAAEKYYPNSKEARKKGCPKSAFLGLCEEGYISGVPKGSYTKSIKNKQYALEARNLLLSNPHLKPNELWAKISSKSHNEQMNVVSALFHAGLMK